MEIAITGNGGWGTANTLLLAGYGHQVTIWDTTRSISKKCELPAKVQHKL